jgi:hypothetical protein
MASKLSKMNEFRFENSLTMTESQYLAVWALLPARRLSRIIRLSALLAVGIVFLFTPYTLLLGVILLVLVGLYIFLPRIIPAGTRSLFREHRYLRDALTYGVSDQKLWVKGATLDANVSWSMLVTWREKEGWLVLSASGIPPVYLSLSRLREEGLYDYVKDLASRNANEFK